MIASVIFCSKLQSSFLLIVSIPLFSQVPTLQTVTLKIQNYGFDRFSTVHFLTLSHLCLGFDQYIGNHWARSTKPQLR